MALASLDSIKISSFNANGLRSKNKRQAIFNWLKGHKQNILFLQECHSNPDIENQWRQDLDEYNVYFSHGTSSAKGVSIVC